MPSHKHGRLDSHHQQVLPSTYGQACSDLCVTAGLMYYMVSVLGDAFIQQASKAHPEMAKQSAPDRVWHALGSVKLSKGRHAIFWRHELPRESSIFVVFRLARNDFIFVLVVAHLGQA